MEIIVNEDNIRIDKYLSNNTSYSRSTIEKMINDEFILVNEKKVKSSYMVKTNDIININEDYVKPIKLQAEEIPLDIVYEDDYLMIINKPSGMVVHPGSGNKNHTLVNALLNYTENLSDIDSDRQGIVHRLDKDTSGLMIVAKTNECHALLSEGFKNKTIKREYIALINGVFPNNTAKIDIPIGRSKSIFNKQEVRSDGKKAVTNLKVIKRYKHYTLVKLSLETGRTHQIRVHLSYIGYPIFNDPVYSKNKATPFGQFLHSTSIDFVHPITHKNMHFECDIPKEFQDFINKL